MTSKPPQKEVLFGAFSELIVKIVKIPLKLVYSRKNDLFISPKVSMNPGEESKHQIFNVNISDVGSVDSRSTVPRRPRSSSQPTENNERIIKEPFLSPRRKLDKRIETMSSCSNTKPKPAFSEC